MRVVLDSNVLIAALIAKGACATLFEHCILNHKVLASEFILDEVEQHLSKKFKFTAAETSDAMSLLRSQTELVAPVPLEQRVCRDADDDQVLGTSLAANADCLITGDNDLLILQRFGTTEIVSPRQFADFETGNRS